MINTNTLKYASTLALSTFAVNILTVAFYFSHSSYIFNTIKKGTLPFNALLSTMLSLTFEWPFVCMMCVFFMQQLSTVPKLNFPMGTVKSSGVKGEEKLKV